MALVKGQDAHEIARQAVVLDLGDLRRQAERMRAEAQAKADRIVAEAEAEARVRAERIAAQAKAQGHAEGRAEGLEQGRAEGHAEALAAAQDRLDQLAAAWTAAVDQWEAERRQMLVDARQSMLELALAIGAKIVKRVPEIAPTVVQDQIAAAMDQIARPADVTVCIHPDDRPLVEEALPELVSRFDQVTHAQLAEDATIEPGGCVLKYGRGRIDATLDTQLRRLVEQLLPATTPGRGEGEGDSSADSSAAS